MASKEERAKDITLKIFRIILEEQNGYSPSEIKERELAEDCETSEFFQKIEKLIKSQIK
jgi:hypothetical protein